jgi:hypothetical protein
MLELFPRPPHDNGIGVHGPPGQWAKGLESDWDIWQERLLALQIKWFKILDDGSGSSFKTIERLIDIDIMPVVRFYRQEPNPGLIDGGNLAYVRRCVEVGAVYFETNNEPDLALEWRDRKRPENWLEIVVDQFIQEASWIRDIGGYLLFPAFGPGGRENPFELIVEQGRIDLLEGNMCLAIHNYCLGRPLDYPNDKINTEGLVLTQNVWENTAPDKKENGPMWAWEMGWDQVSDFRAQLANPNADIMADSTCYRAFEYFDALVQQACGHSIPIFTTEGGYNVGQRAGTTAGDDPRYPKPSPLETSRLTMDMWRHLNGEAPDYYFASMPWIIAVKAVGYWQDYFEEQGPWYTDKFNYDFENCKGQLPLVDMMTKAVWQDRADGPLPAHWQGIGNGENGGIKMWFDEYKEHYLAEGPLNDAGEYDVIVDVLSPEKEELYYQCMGVVHLPGHLNAGKHNIYVDLVDEDGKRIMNSYVEWGWLGMRVDETPGPIVIDKPSNEISSVPMHWGQTIWLEPAGFRTDIVQGMNTAHPDEDEGNTIGHHSFYVLFQRTQTMTTPELPEIPDFECMEEVIRLVNKTSEMLTVLSDYAEQVNEALEALRNCLEDVAEKDK